MEAKQLKTDASVLDAVAPVLHDIGPKYGVRAHLKDLKRGIETALQIEEQWYNAAQKATRRKLGRPAIEALADLYDTYLDVRQCYDRQRIWTTRLGKPCLKVIAYVPWPITIKTWRLSEEIDSYHEDALYVRRMEVVYCENRVDMTTTPSHMALNRHALERLYERDLCTLASFPQTLRTNAMRTLEALALSSALGLHHVTVKNDSASTNIYHAVPFGDGLVVTSGHFFVEAINQNMTSCASFGLPSASGSTLFATGRRCRSSSSAPIAMKNISGKSPALWTSSTMNWPRSWPSSRTAKGWQHNVPLFPLPQTAQPACCPVPRLRHVGSQLRA